MKYLLPFSLAAVAALSVAGCATNTNTNSSSNTDSYTIAQTSGGPDCLRMARPGDTKIRIYCRELQPESTSADTTAQASNATSCRALERANGKLSRFCVDAARWDQYDTWAASAGMSCRWQRLGGSAKELTETCRSNVLWRALGAAGSPRAVASTGSNWPGNSSLATNNPGSQSYGTSSYGYFPAGKSIGAQ